MRALWLSILIASVTLHWQSPITSGFLIQHPIVQPQIAGDTIYQVIHDDPKYSRLLLAINKSDQLVSTLNDTASNITFFAVPDWIFRSPREDYVFSETEDTTVCASLACLDGSGSLDKDTSGKTKLLEAILRYHILPSAALDSALLTQNVTHPTNLTFDGALCGQPLRLRIESTFLPPQIIINFHSKIVESQITASNGIIHTIDHPLLPPPSLFQELFMDSIRFSILTSALQRSNLTEHVDFRPFRKHKGAPLLTIFAPSNRAFAILPPKLRQYLFSISGERALRKLLQYHIAPSVVLHSDYIAYEKSENLEQLERDTHKLVVPTLLTGQNLSVQITKRNIRLPFPGPRHPDIVRWRLTVNGQSVSTSDVTGLNGAIHVVDTLLNPCSTPRVGIVCHSGGTGWENWQEWLPLWAAEDDTASLHMY